MGAELTPGRGSARRTAEQLIVETVLRSPTTLGEGRLVCVDGPAGSGKTTLAAALQHDLAAALGAPVPVVHMDHVFAGWTGLAEGMRVVAEDLVAPLRAGRAGRYRRFDWHRDRYAEEHVVDPGPTLVIEGVGSGQAAYAAAMTALVWVEAPSDVRLERGLARDGEALRDRWLAWRIEEDAMFARERTRERADLLVDGTTGENV